MLESIANLVVNLISNLGYPGIVIAMIVESALVPLPSEIIMPFSGFLASTGRFDLGLVALCGAVGNVIGSLIAYGIGYWGHEKLVRRLVRNYGKWILFSEHELDLAEKMLNRYKIWVVLGSRVLPGVRTVISLPAGFAKLPLGSFIVLTFIGSLVWSYLLAWIGFTLGQNWKEIGPYFHKFDVVVVGIIAAAIAFYIYHKLKNHKPKK